MDALKLKLRAKDQLHPLLSDLVSGYTRFKSSAEWEGRPKMLHWCVLFRRIFTGNLIMLTICRLITLNQMRASEEITEEQSRQVRSLAPCRFERRYC